MQARCCESPLMKQTTRENKLGETNPALICGRFPAYVESVKASHEYKQAEALKAAREWMAINAGGDDWSNRVRQMLNEATGWNGSEYINK